MEGVEMGMEEVRRGDGDGGGEEGRWGWRR